MQGKHTRTMAAAELASALAGYNAVLIDLGTGDGRFVLHAARQDPRIFAIGVDACRENLRAPSRTAPANALFIIADAAGEPKTQPDGGLPASAGGFPAPAGGFPAPAGGFPAPAGGLPAPLLGLAAKVTINFPWGSLRDGLLSADPRLPAGLWELLRPGGQVEVRLNASALAEAGWELQAGGQQAAQNLAKAGFQVRPPRVLDMQDLRSLPSTWAKRLAFGRSPEAVYLQAKKADIKNNLFITQADRQGFLQR